jgi:hypothetical protein
MYFESLSRKEPFYQKESREIAEASGQKRQKPYVMNSSVTEDIQVEPEVFFTGVIKLPISKSQTLERTRIKNKMISPQTQTQQPGQPERKLTENMVARNEVIEPRQENNISSKNTPKLKRVAPHEYPRVPLQQDSIIVQPSLGAVSMNDANEFFSSPEISKSLMGKAQKPLISATIGNKTSSLMPINQYMETGRSESDIAKTFLPEKQFRSNHRDSFPEVPVSGRVFTPKVIRKYSQGLNIDAQKTIAEEKSIQVTIGRIEIRAVPPDKPQKQHRAPQVLSLEDYSKRHSQEVDR